VNVLNEDSKAITHVKQSAKYNSDRYRFEELVLSHLRLEAPDSYLDRSVG